MKFQNFLLISLISLFLVDGAMAVNGGGGGHKLGLAGGWRPIKDVNDPHVKEIGQYAISEHNKKAKSDLQFDHVVRGESQVVAGINYRLVIAAKDGSVSNNYEAVVWEKAWEGYRNLTSFKQV